MPINEGNSFHYFGNKNPICPHCDEVIKIDDHELWYLYEEETHEIDCPFCNETLIVTSSANWSFSTDEQES